MTFQVRRAWLLGAGLGLAASSCTSSDGSHHASTQEPAVNTPAPEPVDPNSVASEGIYADLARGSIHADALKFKPDYPLWSDGADKRRWVLLPEGAEIDTRDMDHWRFPVGTRFVKEFSLNGMRLETRVIEHVADTGRLKKDLTLKVYVWNEAQSDAWLTTDGVTDLFGTQHDVPKQKDCIACHVGEPSGTLGFSALQLSESGMLAELEQRGMLSDPPGRAFVLPGTDVERAAIGMLHGNCGHCHTEGTPAEVMRLRVLVSELDAPWSESQLYQTTLGQAIAKWTPRPPGFDTRIVSGEPERSALLYRMEQRNSDESEGEQMPPLATELVDHDAVAAVRAWIAAMPAAPSAMTELDASAQPSEDAGMDAEPASTDVDGATAQEDAGSDAPDVDDAAPEAERDAGVDAGESEAAAGDPLDASAGPDADPPPATDDAATPLPDASSELGSDA